ncbi:transposase family protein [Agrobacterium tumefaciens]
MPRNRKSFAWHSLCQRAVTNMSGNLRNTLSFTQRVATMDVGIFLGTDSFSMMFGFNWCDFPKGGQRHASPVSTSDLIPAGLNAESVHDATDVIIVTASAGSTDSICPHCGTVSRRVHSRSSRVIGDLPCTGRRIALHLSVRRFVYSATNCHRKIFAERFGEGVT